MIGKFLACLCAWLTLLSASPVAAQTLYQPPGSTLPGGTSGQLQCNSSGSFGGVAMSDGQIAIAQASGCPTGNTPSQDLTITDAGVATVPTVKGGANPATTTGALTSGHCPQFSGTAGALADSGAACGGSSASILPTAISGHWYMPPLETTVNGGVQTTARLVCHGQLNLMPAYTVKALGLRINTGGTTYSQAAVYANSGGFPNGAPLGFSSGTDGANTSPGLVNGVLTDSGASGSNFTLPAGLYWACTVSNDSTAVLNVESTAQALTSAFAGSATQANVNTTSASTALVKFQLITCSATTATGCSFPTASSSGWTETPSATQAGVVMNQAN